MDDLTVAIYSYPGHQALLPYLLASIREYGPPARECILIWDDIRQRREPIDFDSLKRTSGVDFRLIRHSSINTWSATVLRWGWIRQQLIKFMSPSYTSTRYTWLIDGDVVLINRPRLFEHERPCLYHVDRPTDPGYVQFMRDYLRIENFYPGDFVASTFLFDRQILREIEAHAVSVTGQTLIECVEHCIGQPTCGQFPFSEYATYGTWVYNHHDHALLPGNWNHCPAGRDPTKPVQVMWHAVPGEEELDLAAKLQRLTTNGHSAIIIE